jgi:hypothetical protein
MIFNAKPVDPSKPKHKIQFGLIPKLKAQWSQRPFPKNCSPFVPTPKISSSPLLVRFTWKPAVREQGGFAAKASAFHRFVRGESSGFFTKITCDLVYKLGWWRLPLLHWLYYWGGVIRMCSYRNVSFIVRGVCVFCCKLHFVLIN